MNAAELAGQDLFNQPVTLLPGVAGKRAALLRRLDITTWYDLLCHFPRDFADWTELTPLRDLADGEEQTFRARVARKPSLSRKGRLSMLRTVLRDDSCSISAIWFNQPYLSERLVKDQWYRFRGKIRRSAQVFSIQNPAFETDQPEEEIKQGVRPVYPLTEGLSQGVLRQLIQAVLPRLIGHLPEPLPDWVRRDHKLCAVDFAYSRIHQPSSLEEADICRRRLAFEELFLIQAGLRLIHRERRQTALSWPVRLNEAVTAGLGQAVAGLPFQLTGAQVRCWQEIQADLCGERPMNRLIQGDVGSGKTVLAALAMLQCALCGCQAVLMAPTSILASQHHQTLGRLLGKSGEKIALLTGATPRHERQQLLAGLACGSIRLLVGTHALIEDQVCFQRLALAITDEQHRFGVRQRIRLSQADQGRQPHIMVMSATPIPRTLGLILYGDLDISVVDELPAGRKPIETYTACDADRPRVEELIRRFVKEGRQAYVVCPMIAEQADSDLESAVNLYNRLAQTVYPELKVGLIHGSLKPDAKDQVMERFMRGEIQILVSTTVIEVGVDNPNAALMIIENAERFGLAQMHQLRGRIGRGGHRSICILFSNADDELVRERLRVLCHAANGFEVAEKDLELRGPGDFFGTRQHGLPALHLANLYRDHDLLQEVQTSIDKLFRDDPGLAKPDNRTILTTLQARYGAVFQQIGL